MLDHQEGHDVLADRIPLYRQCGFTLIEMMITIAVLAILVALALPAMGNWIKNAQIRTAAESLQNGLQKARNEAARQNAAVEFVIGPGSAWTVRLANVNTVIESRPAGEGSPQVVLTPQPAVATTVTFDGMGRRMNANAAGEGPVLTQICVDLPAAVLAAAETHDLELDVSLSGAVRMCDPKVSNLTDNRVCANYPTPCTAL
jgi:type IV fimbrial biogenesis protein FimT